MNLLDQLREWWTQRRATDQEESHDEEKLAIEREVMRLEEKLRLLERRAAWKELR